MPETRRALSSVADVSLALVLVLAAIGVYVGYLDAGDATHDPERTAHTTDALGASTTETSYSLEPILETQSEAVDAPGDDAPYDSADLKRTSHGPMIGHVARAALGNARIPAPDGSERTPLNVGAGFEESLESALVTSLVDAQFYTNVSAVWEPFAGSDIRGSVSLGPRVPRDVDATLVRVTAASELPRGRARALEAVRSTGNETNASFEPVARIVAGALVNETFATAQRDIERGGVDRAVVVSRYLRFADAISGVDRSFAQGDGDFDPSTVDADAMNAVLVDRLTNRFDATLSETFDSPAAAAAAVSTGEVTVSITTWNHD